MAGYMQVKVGMIVGDLRVEYEVGPELWDCICRCSNHATFTSEQLLSGMATYCWDSHEMPRNEKGKIA